MSAKLSLTITLIPKSSNAQGACSLEEPQPKFFPVIKIFEFVYGFWFNIKLLNMKIN